MSRVFSNFTNLSFIRLFDMAFPLITVPMLLAALGQNGYGEIVFFSSINVFFVLLVNFGFEESAVKQLSNRHVKGLEYGDVVGAVILAKACLSVLSIGLYFFTLYVFGLVNSLSVFFVGLILVEVFNALWFFIAIEKLKYFSVTNTISKVLYILLLFVFVDSKEDIDHVPLVISISYFVGHFLSFVVMIRMSKINGWIGFLGFRRLILDSFGCFLSNFIPVIKDRVGAVVIGAQLGMNLVAIFDIFQKILLVSMQPISVINSSFFPELSRKFSVVRLKKPLFLGLGYVAALLVFSVLFLFWVVPAVLPNYREYSLLAFVMLLSNIFFVGSILLAKNILIVNGRYGLLVVSSAVVSLFYLIAIAGMLMFDYLTLTAMVIVTVATFFVEFSTRFYLVKKSGLLKNS